MQWKNAIKKAGAEYRSGKIGKVKKKKSYQTGRSNKKADSQRKAKRPGARRSASGKKYTERRKNRSDAPGMLTGITTGTLAAILRRRKRSELANALLRRETATTQKGYNAAKKAVIIKRSELNRLQ